MPKKKRRDSLPPMVRVIWQDASHSADTEGTAAHIADDEMGVLMCTVGHVVSDDENGIRVAVDYYMDGSERFRSISDIPRSYIKKVRRIK